MTLDYHHWKCRMHDGSLCGVKHRTWQTAERHAQRIYDDYLPDIEGHSAPGETAWLDPEFVQDDISDCDCDIR